jgi:hypothetical protein
MLHAIERAGRGAAIRYGPNGAKLKFSHRSNSTYRGDLFGFAKPSVRLATIGVLMVSGQMALMRMPAQRIRAPRSW